MVLFHLPYLLKNSVFIKNLLANAREVKDTDQSLGQEDPLEEEMSTHSSILAWRIPGIEEPGGLQFMGWQESDTT